MCFLAGCMPPYAQEYKWQHGSVPWSTFTVYLEESFGDAPWLSLLPPEAQRSLHTWGRCIFSQTALCKRGSVSVDRYGDWLRDASSFRLRTSPADTLAKCCAAFAHSPLSLVIDVQVAVQCASLAMRELMGTERGRMVLPSYVEDKLDFVCAAGCGKDLSRRFVCNDQFGHRVKYCSDKCARAVRNMQCSTLPAHAYFPPMYACDNMAARRARVVAVVYLVACFCAFALCAQHIA